MTAAAAGEIRKTALKKLNNFRLKTVGTEINRIDELIYFSHMAKQNSIKNVLGESYH